MTANEQLIALGMIVLMIFALFFILFLWSLSPFLLFFLAMLIVFILWLRHAQKQSQKLSQRRDEAIAKAKDLDDQFVQLLESYPPKTSWEEKGKSISKLPYEAKPQLTEFEEELAKRQESLNELNDLIKNEKKLKTTGRRSSPTFTNSIAQDLAHEDSDEFKRGAAKLDLYEHLLVAYALEELWLPATEFEINVEPIIEQFQSVINSGKINSIDWEKSAVECGARLVIIDRLNPYVDITRQVEALNRAIREGSDISVFHSEVDELYEILEISLKMDTFLEEVDLSHTSLSEKQYRSDFENAISDQDIVTLRDLNEKVDSIAETRWAVEDLFRFDWESFEHLIADLWKDKGYKTAVTQRGADEGVDVRASKKNGSDHLLIQAKRYSSGNKVGRPDVQKTSGTLNTDSASRAVVVTSSDFTLPAVQEAAKAGKQMTLVNGKELVKELNESNIAPPRSDGGSVRRNKYDVDVDPFSVIFQSLDGEIQISGVTALAQCGDKSESRSDRLKQSSNISQEESGEHNGISTTESVSREDNEGRQKSEDSRIEVGDQGHERSNDHPFGRIPNPNQTVERLDDVDSPCPSCGAVRSIWKTKNVNTRTRYKCGQCEEVWRRKSALISQIEGIQKRESATSLGGEVSSSVGRECEFCGQQSDDIIPVHISSERTISLCSGCTKQIDIPDLGRDPAD